MNRKQFQSTFELFKIWLDKWFNSKVSSSSVEDLALLEKELIESLCLCSKNCLSGDCNNTGDFVEGNGYCEICSIKECK